MTLDLPNFLSILRRNRILIAAATLATMLLAGIFAKTTLPTFSATAFVIIDARNARVTIDQNNVPLTPTQLGLDQGAVDSQVQILGSEEIALKVIRETGLDKDPNFLAPNNVIVGWIQGVVGSIMGLMPSSNSSDDNAVIMTDGIPRTVIEAFQSRLTLKRLDETYVIAIRFDATDRDTAAKVANAVASAYLNDELNARFDSVRRASLWMEQRLAELRQEVMRSDHAVQNFRKKNDIYFTGANAGSTSGSGQGQLLADQALSRLSDDAAAAERVRGERQARYDQIQQVIEAGNPDAAVPDALTNDVIVKLRNQYVQNAQRQSEIVRRYGANHEAAQRIAFTNQEIGRLIMQEFERIAQSYRNELQTAVKQEEDLNAALEKAKSAAFASGSTQVSLRELQRETDTYRTLYEKLLDRYNSAMQQQTFPITDARILTKASPPRTKSGPKTVLFLLLGGVAGAMLGVGAAFARELTDGTFRTPSEVEENLGLPVLGVVPKLSEKRLQEVTGTALAARNVPAGSLVLPGYIGLLQYSADKPFSRLAETMRASKVAADLALMNRQTRVIGVVSSVPGEGKSTIAMNLGEVIASSGRRVLVMDCDLRNPTLSTAAAPDRKSGLVEYLADGTVSASELIYVDPYKPLQFLPANGNVRLPQTPELLSSQRMVDLLSSLRQSFDYIVIDLPPLAPVVDVRAMVNNVDAFVFVVGWGKTSVATAQQALSAMPGLAEKTIGVVLNSVDVDQMRTYTKANGGEYYDYDRFETYTTQH
ncbi:polysaccharide biosynthesis tyrosine autokinase [Xanthobacter autotrophicus]|uniref:polysaccharide biosynthesis tyrosine autokinase n=1 Tax=Xanthobacter autotrophicus TaxID=280 RepID=UPI0024A65BAB|nr:polysaccharide biosynthesis tyrosine autokinase [Xanthobacter autotrophicus]MDI4658328.1 polysaccharide biosynthesis tyrosine autokinase [Xanthobacter autotrophicus]